MKKWLIYLGGIVTGAVLMLVLMFLNSYDFENSSKTTDDISLERERDSIRYASEREHEERLFLLGEVINERSFKVFQVFMDNQALVYGKDKYGNYCGTVYFLIGERGKTFYDDEIIEVQSSQIVKMGGTYRYTTNSGEHKTVPKIRIMNKY